MQDLTPGFERRTYALTVLVRSDVLDVRPVLFVSLLSVLGLCGCSDSQRAAPTTKAVAPGLQLVAAPRTLVAKCRATARAVGYAVPCPLRVPEGLVATPAQPDNAAALGVIGPGGVGGAAKTWRGWVVGSSNAGPQHLVITASPKRLTNDAKLVNGPAWYPGAKVRPIGWVEIDGRRMRAVYVPPATNDGSSFMHHVVLIWSNAGHTYGLGFHNVSGIRRTLRLDEELAKHVELVGPTTRR